MQLLELQNSAEAFLHTQPRSDEFDNAGDDSSLLLYTTFEVSVQLFVLVQLNKDDLHAQACSNQSFTLYCIYTVPLSRIVTSCTLLPVTAGLVVRVFCLLFIFNEGFLTPLCRGHKRCFAYRRRTSRRPFINRFETPTWKNLMPIAKKDFR